MPRRGDWVDRLARLGITQPIAAPVPADDAHFLASKGRFRVVQRLLKRGLEVLLSGQRGRRRERIEPGWKRAIWFHAEAPQIGDALMDLAPRSLLAEHGIAVDLLAPPATAALFSGDRLLHRVTADEAGIAAADYDFAIVDADSRLALTAKRRRAPDLPWVSIRARYLGYDFQRGLLATRRLAELLGVQLSAADEARHARQKLLVETTVEEVAAASSRPRIAVALGGVRAERSYRQWIGVAERLLAERDCEFILLGSANARADRDAWLAGPAALAQRSLDQVERTNLPGAAATMAGCDLVLCADGGLMHLALTTTTPVLALFDASVDPAWRLPASFEGKALRADGRDVNRISLEDVAAAALALLTPRKVGSVVSA